jgi:methyl-accepting chemotaxis protein
MDDEIKKIIENGFNQIIDELKSINNTIILNGQTVNDKLNSIYEHIYYIDKNTS